MGKMQIVKLKV